MKNYFSTKETVCKDGCGKDITPDTRALANRVREEWTAHLNLQGIVDDVGLNCDSGARCENHTLALRAKGIPAALHSAHLEGLAIDLSPINGDIKAFHDFCLERLERWGCWAEHPSKTPLWMHLQLRPVPGKHVFMP